ncbi:Zn(II)2Cys6 transcription factor [Aspergillus stella-maris]|uniref:Zn(II)2Cys6 transcription factor n=1 Tax=Aspergillus stella-maris TaxID=1810926 RepID=UPI003CCCE68A
MSRRSKGECHTCRRHRLKCDEGKPRCQRCYASGVECLGYDNLIRWVNGVASRGKMMGKFFPSNMFMPVATEPCNDGRGFTNQPMLYDSLLHPWLQRLDHPTRHYLAHFLINVGNDLTIYNLPSQTTQNNQIYALQAKGRAFRLLNQEINNLNPSNYTTSLASLMLLAEFAVLESSDDTWRIHLLAAARLVRLIRTSYSAISDDSESDERSLRSWTIARLILQDTFGSSLSSSIETWNIPDLCAAVNGIDTALKYAEVEHYTACPSSISSVIQAARSIYDAGTEPSCCTPSPSTQCIFLTLQEFNPSTWTMYLQSQSLTPATESTERYHINSAYKAAATLYSLQAVPDTYLDSCAHTPPRSTDLVDEILQHVSQVSPSHPLFKATIWPIYIAGAESGDALRREVVLQHVRCLSGVLPWQSMFGAEKVLREFWGRLDSVDEILATGRGRWLAEFRAMGAAVYPA